jgi:broad specificity phosphatase PhoE
MLFISNSQVCQILSIEPNAFGTALDLMKFVCYYLGSKFLLAVNILVNQTHQLVTLLLVRHGDYKNSHELKGKPCYKKDTDPKFGLTDSGAKQIEGLGDYLIEYKVPVARIITSDATRAYESADILALKLGIPVLDIAINQNLIELDADECDLFMTNQTSALESARNRANLWADSLLQNTENKGKIILCITHGLPIKTIIERLYPYPEEVTVANASMTVVTHHQETGETELGATNTFFY